jgi:hypothetical protein
MTDSPHDVLGTTRGDSAARVRAAFRRYARAHHPDRGGDPAAFRRGLEAYRALRRSADVPTQNVAFYRRPRGLALPLAWWRRRRRPPRVR